MATQLYTIAEVYFNQKKMMEEASVKITRDTKAQPVNTVARGFAGMSQGSRELQISVESAVPAADFEMNPGQYMGSMTPITLTISAAGHVLTTQGFITKDDFSHSVNSEAKLSFEFMGEYADWEKI